MSRIGTTFLYQKGQHYRFSADPVKSNGSISECKIGIDNHVNVVFGGSRFWSRDIKLFLVLLVKSSSKKRRLELKYLLTILAAAGLALSSPAEANDYYDFTSQTARLTSVIADSLKPSTQADLICLSLNIYHESRGSTLNDQLSVGFVTRNRQLATNKSLCEVVYERHWVQSRGRMVSQFSWTTTGVKNRRLERAAWDHAQRLAYGVMFDSEIEDPTRGATYFHESNISPGWSRHAVNRHRYGTHTFFNLVELATTRRSRVPS